MYLVLTDNLQQAFWLLDKEALIKGLQCSSWYLQCFFLFFFEELAKYCYQAWVFTTNSVTTIVKNTLTFVASDFIKLFPPALSIKWNLDWD